MIRPIIIFLLLTQFCYSFRYAIVVGRNEGGKKVDSLHFAEKDAGHFSTILTNMAGFSEENLTTLISPNESQVIDAFNELAQKVNHNKDLENSMFLFYYSGHADGENLNLGEEKLSLVKIMEAIKKFPTQIKLSLFDACQSGAVTRLKGGTIGAPFYLESQKQVTGQIIISSSAANELAQESDELKGSIFSHHLFNGLRGSADISGDKKVTIQEAYRYAYDKTVETTAFTGGGVQHPSYNFKIIGQGEIVLTDLNQNKSGVYFDQSVYGRHLILNKNYSFVVADFYKDKGMKQYIALDPGQYSIINRKGRESGHQEIDVIEDVYHHVNSDSFLFYESFVNYKPKGTNSYVAKKTVEFQQSPFTAFSTAFSIGSLTPTSKTLKDIRERNLQLGIKGFIYLQKKLDLTVDLNWLLPKEQIGFNIGFNYYLETARLQPFIGAEMGIGYALDSANGFYDAIGATGGAKLGMLVDTFKFFQIGFQIPYQISLNQRAHHRVGVELIANFNFY